MSLAIVRSNSLLLCGPHGKRARIRQQPELTDGAVMALIAPWQGLIKGRPQDTTVHDEVKESNTVRDGN